MTILFGHSRSVVAERYALFTPEGLVRAPLPGWPGATCCVVIGPGLGARFAQLLIELDPDGLGMRTHSDDELLIFVRAGARGCRWARTTRSWAWAATPTSRLA